MVQELGGGVFIKKPIQKIEFDIAGNKVLVSMYPDTYTYDFTVFADTVILDFRGQLEFIDEDHCVETIVTYVQDYISDEE